MEAVLRKNVTFKTLVDLRDDFITFVWSFNHGSQLVPIVTVTPTGETVAEGYQGRVLVNRTNGFLTLGSVEAKDRGYYYATIVTSEKIKTGETMLRVLGESFFVIVSIYLVSQPVSPLISKVSLYVKWGRQNISFTFTAIE